MATGEAGGCGGGAGGPRPRLTSLSRHTTHSEVCTSSSAGGADGLTDSGSSSGAVGSGAPGTSPWGGFSSSVGTKRQAEPGSLPMIPFSRGRPRPCLPQVGRELEGGGTLISELGEGLPSHTPSHFSSLTSLPICKMGVRGRGQGRPQHWLTGASHPSHPRDPYWPPCEWGSSLSERPSEAKPLVQGYRATWWWSCGAGACGRGLQRGLGNSQFTQKADGPLPSHDPEDQGED